MLKKSFNSALRLSGRNTSILFGASVPHVNFAYQMYKPKRGHLKEYWLKSYEDSPIRRKNDKVILNKLHFKTMLQKAGTPGDISALVQAVYDYLGNGYLFKSGLLDKLVLKASKLDAGDQVVDIITHHDYLQYFPHPDAVRAVYKNLISGGDTYKLGEIAEALLKKRYLISEKSDFLALINGFNDAGEADKANEFYKKWLLSRRYDADSVSEISVITSLFRSTVEAKAEELGEIKDEFVNFANDLHKFNQSYLLFDSWKAITEDATVGLNSLQTVITYIKTTKSGSAFNQNVAKFMLAPLLENEDSQDIAKEALNNLITAINSEEASSELAKLLNPVVEEEQVDEAEVETGTETEASAPDEESTEEKSS